MPEQTAEQTHESKRTNKANKATTSSQDDAEVLRKISDLGRLALNNTNAEEARTSAVKAIELIHTNEVVLATKAQINDALKRAFDAGRTSIQGEQEPTTKQKITYGAIGFGLCLLAKGQKLL